MKDEREKLKKMADKRQEIEELNEELNCALLLRELFPGAKWPVYTAIRNDAGKYSFQIRDSNGAFKVLPIEEVPFLLLNRPHITKVCESHPRLYAKIYGRRKWNQSTT